MVVTESGMFIHLFILKAPLNVNAACQAMCFGYGFRPMCLIMYFKRKRFDFSIKKKANMQMSTDLIYAYTHIISGKTFIHHGVFFHFKKILPTMPFVLMGFHQAYVCMCL